jgi:hypothetical protein
MCFTSGKHMIMFFSIVSSIQTELGGFTRSLNVPALYFFVKDKYKK